jgi:hypothetical protein
MPLAFRVHADGHRSPGLTPAHHPDILEKISLYATVFLLYGGLFFLNPATPQWLKVSAGPHPSAVRSSPTGWCHQDGLRLPQELLAALLLIFNILVIALFVCECSACILAVAAVRCPPACLQIPDLPLPPAVNIIKELLLSIIWHIDEHSNGTLCVFFRKKERKIYARCQACVKGARAWLGPPDLFVPGHSRQPDTLTRTFCQRGVPLPGRGVFYKERNIYARCHACVKGTRAWLGPPDLFMPGHSRQPDTLTRTFCQRGIPLPGRVNLTA